MTRAGECQGIQDRVTEIALEFADAGEQACSRGTSTLALFDEGEEGVFSIGVSTFSETSCRIKGVPN